MDLAYIKESGYRNISQNSTDPRPINHTYEPQSMSGPVFRTQNSPTSPEDVSRFLVEMGFDHILLDLEPATIPAENSHRSHLDDPIAASSSFENGIYSPFPSGNSFDDSSGSKYPDHYSYPHSNNLQARIPKSHSEHSRHKEPELPTSVEIKPYFFCDIDACSRRYRRLRNLQAHQKMVHGEIYLAFGEETPKPIQDATTDVNKKYHTCAVVGCSKIFTQLRNLWAHQCKCHNNDAFFCNWRPCTERSTDFVTLDAFLQHVAKEHHSKRYVCEVCHQYGSDRKDHMDLHSRRLHPEIVLKKGISGKVPKGKAKEVAEEEDGFQKFL